MNNPDSFDRIISYFQALCKEPFTYKNKVYQPYTELIITDAVFRSYTCPRDCGACCMKCSLVWDTDVKLRNIRYTPQIINGNSVDFWTDRQLSHKGDKCQYLGTHAVCSIYPLRPLPCRFELFRFIHHPSSSKVYARVDLPGRSWALTRTTKEKGSLCKITPFDRSMTLSHVADLFIIKGWMDKFCIANDVECVINYLLTGPHRERLLIDRRKANGMFLI